MRKFTKTYALIGAGNLISFFLFLVCPMKWSCPFGAAYMAAAGYGGISFAAAGPGCLLACLVGKGGFGAAAGGLLAFLLSSFFNNRIEDNARANVSLIALLACAAPGISYHLAYGAFDTVAAAVCAAAAMAACPVMMPAVKRAFLARLTPDAQEKLACLFLCAIIIAGVFQLFAPAGYLLSGLFSLCLSYGGLYSGCAGALTAAVGILFGGQGAAEIALLMLCACASGAFSQSVFLQAGVFLIGIPLGLYMNVSREAAFLLAAAAAYPWIPRAYLSCAARYLGFFNERAHANFAAVTSRRHLSPVAGEICGDAGEAEKLENGHLLLMLADGMGTGSAAREISQRALENAGCVFRAGLSEPEAMKCLNALCASGRETHTTMDICLIDLVTGRAKFIKSGAEPTWVLSGGGITRLESESLPLGALENAPPDQKTRMLKSEDMIFMATDGLLNALGGAGEAERLLKEFQSMTPARLCAEMMKKARQADAARRKDDMSCLCARLHAKNAFAHQRQFLPDAAVKKAG